MALRIALKVEHTSDVLKGIHIVSINIRVQVRKGEKTCVQ